MTEVSRALQFMRVHAGHELSLADNPSVGLC